MRALAISALLLAAGFGMYSIALVFEVKHPLIVVACGGGALGMVYIGEMWSVWRRG